MRLAVTVGFESKLVIRAITRLGPTRGVVFLRGITGREGDRQSEETVRDLVKILGYGEDVAVDLRDLEEAFGKLAEIDFDAVALAGGPRLLVVLAFLAAMYKGRGVYVVPEYDPEPIDVSHLARLPSISALSPTRLRILASLDGDKTYREVASDVGVDSSTALRHLEGLRRLGLVERAGGRLPRYRAGPAVVRLSRVLLRIKSRRSL